MSKSYLFVYSSELGTRTALRELIDNMTEITNWRYELPNAFFLISDATAVQLSARIQALTENRGRFLVTEVGPNKQGLLVPDTWHFLNERPLPEK